MFEPAHLLKGEARRLQRRILDSLEKPEVRCLLYLHFWLNIC